LGPGAESSVMPVMSAGSAHSAGRHMSVAFVHACIESQTCAQRAMTPWPMQTRPCPHTRGGFACELQAIPGPVTSIALMGGAPHPGAEVPIPTVPASVVVRVMLTVSAHWQICRGASALDWGQGLVAAKMSQPARQLPHG